MKPARVPVPNELVTATAPDEPAAITAVIVVADTLLNEAAGVPPKLTLVTPVKFVPVIVITEPGCPDAGLNEVMVGTAGGGGTLNHCHITEVSLPVTFDATSMMVSMPSAGLCV